MSFDLALVDSDISIKPDGTLRTVTDTNKLKQDVVKIILTPLNSVRFHPWYGSDINEGLIGEVPTDSILFQKISGALTQSLNRLQTLQRSQATGQRVTPAEMIAAIRSVSVQRAIDDPRQVNVVVILLSKDLTAIEEIFSIS